MNVITLEKKLIEAENKLHTAHGGNLNYSRFRDLIRNAKNVNSYKLQKICVGK